jgi:hypothetical protein
MAKKAQTAVVAAADADVEVVAKPGLGIDEGIVLTTFFLLVGAIVLVVLANQKYGV